MVRSLILILASFCVVSAVRSDIRKINDAMNEDEKVEVEPPAAFQETVKKGDHSEVSLPAAEDKSADVGDSRWDFALKKVLGGCKLGWPKKCQMGFVECGEASEAKKCGLFKKDFQKFCCSTEVEKVPGGCSLGWPKKCGKGFVECGEATEEKKCGLFKKDLQKLCCAKAKVSHAGERVPGGCRLGWPKKCEKGFVECGEATDEKKCGLFKKDFQKLCCGEDD